MRGSQKVDTSERRGASCAVDSRFRGNDRHSQAGRGRSCAPPSLTPLTCSRHSYVSSWNADGWKRRSKAGACWLAGV